MYSVNLVDDDALILEELVYRVPWMDNMFEVAGSETDPRKAYPEAREQRGYPDGP